MKAIDYWRLCERLTVRQAALLMMGEDPGDYMSNHTVENPYEAIVSALLGALRNKSVEGYIEPAEFGPEENGSIVYAKSLKVWLQGKGIATGFFFPDSTVAPDYLNRENPNYSPKLAAAVNAWLAVTSDKAYQDNGKSVKTNAVNWLTAHAAEYGLLKEDGSINSSAINDQIAPTVNFNTKGGAPSTPESKPAPADREPPQIGDSDLENIPF